MSVRHALLALLSEGPKYGLQLREEFEARTGEVWPLNVGQVYTTLQRLERDGLVESEGAGEGPQKAFKIIATGMAELGDWLRTPPDLSSPPRDELVMKVLVAIRVPGTDVLDVIQAHRRYLVQLMQQWTRIKEGGAEDDLNLALAVDAELFRLDSVVRWLDAVDARLQRAAAEGHIQRGTHSRAQRLRERRQWQTDTRLNETFLCHGPFQRHGIAFDKQRLVQRAQGGIDTLDQRTIALQRGRAQLSHFSRHNIRGHRDHPSRPVEDRLRRALIIAGQY